MTLRENLINGSWYTVDGCESTLSIWNGRDARFDSNLSMVIQQSATSFQEKPLSIRDYRPGPLLSFPSLSFWRFWLFSRYTRARVPTHTHYIHARTLEHTIQQILQQSLSRFRSWIAWPLSGNSHSPEEADSPCAHSSCYFRRTEL